MRSAAGTCANLIRAQFCSTSSVRVSKDSREQLKHRFTNLARLAGLVSQARTSGAAEARYRSQRSTGGSPGQITPSQELHHGCKEEEGEGEEEEVVFVKKQKGHWRSASAPLLIPTGRATGVRTEAQTTRRRPIPRGVPIPGLDPIHRRQTGADLRGVRRSKSRCPWPRPVRRQSRSLDRFPRSASAYRLQRMLFHRKEQLHALRSNAHPVPLRSVSQLAL